MRLRVPLRLLLGGQSIISDKWLYLDEEINITQNKISWELFQF
jgi:hypothetical protein